MDKVHDRRLTLSGYLGMRGKGASTFKELLMKRDVDDARTPADRGALKDVVPSGTFHGEDIVPPGTFH